jgi:hypothetical protein
MTTKTAGSRRRFLLGAGTASASAVAAVALSGKGVAPPTKQAARPAGRGYQLTEHVRNYYRTTAV